jgi:hypothetical protein
LSGSSHGAGSGAVLVTVGAGVDATGVDGAGVDATGVDATGVDATGVDATGADEGGGDDCTGAGAAAGAGTGVALTGSGSGSQVTATATATAVTPRATAVRCRGPRAAKAPSWRRSRPATRVAITHSPSSGNESATIDSAVTTAGTTA